MRAVIYLEDEINSTLMRFIKRINPEEYCIIAASENVAKKIDAYKVLKIDIQHEAYGDIEPCFTLYNQLTEEFEKINQDSMVDLILPYMNGFSKLTYHFINHVLVQIEGLIKSENITNVTFINGHDKLPFTSIFFSEGERPFRLMYTRSRYLNYFINKFLLDKGISTEWVAKESKVKLLFYRFVRREFMILIRFLIYFKMWFTAKAAIKRKKFVYSFNDDKNDKITFLLARNIVQVSPLLNIYHELKRQKKRPLFVAMDMLQRGNCTSYLSKKGIDYLSLTGLLTIKDLFSILGLTINLRKHLALMPNFMINNVYINGEDLMREISSSWIEGLIRYRLLNKVLEKINQVETIFTTETFNHNAAIEGLWAKDNRIPIYTIQHTTYWKGIAPINVWTNGIFFMTYDIYRFFLEHCPNEREKFNYVGPISYDYYFNSKKNVKGKISIFTQPDDFLNEYINITNDVAKSVKNIGKSVIVKLHPREKRKKFFQKKFSNIINETGIMGSISNEESNEIIRNSEVSISISSGTIYQSILIGIPPIRVNYEKKYNTDESKVDFLSHPVTYEVCNREELQYALNNIEIIHEKFQFFREDYLDKVLPGYTGNSTMKMLEVVERLRHKSSSLERST
ncbi:hypothetical protein [Cytobacillus dafuensis]|uniref:Uncharacterized protein n=1 Tax=Cytobacillus dafuensis TaxID=1742359 RepID=A0A5B8Z8B1_CYTDA|nr:hypothetical protein [Cytobacillus dafuensis]QED49190.1 hypothetical protein FSZ17_19090 [Cytobacillus dafuensis]